MWRTGDEIAMLAAAAFQHELLPATQTWACEAVEQWVVICHF